VPLCRRRVNTGAQIATCENWPPLSLDVAEDRDVITLEDWAEIEGPQPVALAGRNPESQAFTSSSTPPPPASQSSPSPRTPTNEKPHPRSRTLRPDPARRLYGRRNRQAIAAFENRIAARLLHSRSPSSRRE
jgi:hypothetical protein